MPPAMLALTETILCEVKIGLPKAPLKSSPLLAERETVFSALCAPQPLTNRLCGAFGRLSVVYPISVLGGYTAPDSGSFALLKRPDLYSLRKQFV